MSRRPSLKKPKTMEERIDLLRAALTLIAYSKSTVTPAQFVQALQKMARDALIDDAPPGEV